MSGTTSGASVEGEALGAPDACGDRPGTWCGIQRHKRAKQPQCADCRAFGSAYSRQWYREARAIPAFRERHNQATATNQRRRRQSPRYRTADNAKVQQRIRARKERDRIDRMRAVDPVVVLRLIAGEPCRPNHAERLEAVRQLRDKGLSYPQIGARIGIQQRQVHRDLTELGLIEPKDAVA